MFKYTIEYTDYDDNPRKEELCFNLSVPELIELQRSTPGGYGEKLERVVKSNDNLLLIDTVCELIKLSYGVRSEDGTRFIKKAADGHKLADEFVESPAYEAFLFECMTNSDLGAKFVNELIPQSAIARIKAMSAEAES